MASERIQRQVNRLLDAAEAAIAASDWETVRARALDALRLDPANGEARAMLDAAERDVDAPRPDGGTASPESYAPARESTPLAPPRSAVQGRYQITLLLGEGGKKRVFQAHDTRLGREVAFALIKTEGLDASGRERLRREAQAMARLGDHPHIVTVHDVGEEQGQPYLVSQLMQGGDLASLLAASPEHRLPLEQVISFGAQICQALAHAHAHQVIHRDLKPGNIWLTADGVAKLGDFGLAVALDQTQHTQPGMIMGTVSYMAPEQAIGGVVDTRSDLYALGCVLYELVCGRPPFVGDESVAIITQHLNTQPVALSWHRPDCPPGLESLVLRLLEKDPGQRPRSAGEVADALAGVELRAEGERNTQLLPHVRREDLGLGTIQDPALTSSRIDSSTDPLVNGRMGRGRTASQPGAASPVYQQTFVGREAELRQLQAAYDAARNGQGGLVMVVGEPGIGKTSLCEQLATYATVRGGATLVGHCYEEGSLSLPYLAFVEALRAHVLSREPETVQSALGSGAADVARIVPEVLERMQIEPRAPSGNADVDRWRLLEAVAAFLRDASMIQPLVIVLEDLHWADQGTLDLLLHVARSLAGTRLLIVGTYRDVDVDRSHPLSSTLADLRRTRLFTRVALRGFTVHEVHRMMEQLRGQDVPWNRAEAIHRQTEGNPLFVQEVLRYLVEEGLVIREGGRWVRTDDGSPDAGIPEGLRDVIGKRLSGLSDSTNRVLAMASVIGREFDLDVLAAISSSTEDDIDCALDEATRAAVLVESGARGAIRYRFAHALFRQALYTELNASRRLRLHQQVARALEHRYASRLADHAVELAEHFGQSTSPDDLKKAVSYGLLAAQQARSVYAHAQAAGLLESALEIEGLLDPTSPARRCDLLIALGEVNNLTGAAQTSLD